MSNLELNNKNESLGKSSSTILYRTIWRWHFYAGLFCIPFVLTLALSGTIYLFKPQIDNWLDRPYQNLEISGQRSSANEQIQVALKAVPNADFLNYQLPPNDSHAVIISVQQHSERILVYVHPYSLQVLKIIPYNSQFIRLIRSFHGELLAGNLGSVLIELAGCWAIVLIISGLYLWWPRTTQSSAGILYPRLNKGGRLFWRDLHAVCGFWVSGFTLFLLISGLPWALVWGSAFSQLRELNAPEMEQSWTLSRAQEEMMLTPISDNRVDLTPSLLQAAQSLNFAHPVELALSKQSNTTWTLKSQNQNRLLRSDALLQSQPGKVLGIDTFSEKNTLDKAIGIGISAHEGQLFGWLNQLLGLLITSSLIIISISGFILWRKRKPTGTLGAPIQIPNASVSKVITLIIIVLALVLPLLAISLLTLGLIEYCILRHLKKVRQWLGLHAVVS